MAELLWGKVYHKEQFAGILREEPGASMSFTYDENYLSKGYPAIAHTLPLQSKSHVSEVGLPPFFDNLVAEGWLETVQTRLLGKRAASRFELLLGFGKDCAGAVSVVDPEPKRFSKDLIDIEDPKDMAVMASRSSLSGIQPKLLVLEKGDKLHPAKNGEVSTHIAKFASRHHSDLVANEYLTTRAFKELLPQENVVDLRMGQVEGFPEDVLIIKRFDRESNGERLHFEEFSQLLGFPSRFKYEAAHRDMSGFIQNTEGCLQSEIYHLYLRILAGLLLGNTDMHLKNFAMFHTDAGLRLTPTYDMVSSILYGYQTVALAVGGAKNLVLGQLKASNIIKLGEEFGLNKEAIKMAVDHLEKNITAAKEAVLDSSTGTTLIKDQLIEWIQKRWNGTFGLIGKHLSKKP